jgi:hypothetical protein
MVAPVSWEIMEVLDDVAPDHETQSQVIMTGNSEFIS